MKLDPITAEWLVVVAIEAAALIALIWFLKRK